MNITEHLLWLLNIGSANALVPSGNKPLPEPVLTQIYVSIWQSSVKVNTLRPRQNGRYFAYDIFNAFSLMKTVADWI